jgi:DNA-binding beta-propeller fold protein YncE
MLFVAVAVAAAITAATALAGTGDLTPQGCTEDPGAPDGCADSTGGLSGAVAVAVSPDGKSVYVTGFNSSSIVRFDRSLTTGTLTPRGCINDDDTGDVGCTVHAPGLDGARGVTVSPDGKSVYVTGALDNSIAIFKRSKSGALTSKGCIEDNDVGPDSCAKKTNGLGAPVTVAVSPDGKSVYAATATDNAIVQFKRDKQTGALTGKGCIDDNDSGPDTCTDSADGLDQAFGVAVSPDGKSVYAVSNADWALVAFKRDKSSGALTPKGCFDDSGADACAGAAPGLDGANSLVVTPDGGSVYVASENAVARFDRSSNGTLKPKGCIEDNDSGPLAECTASVDGLTQAFGIGTSPDGRSVYVAATGDNSIVRFDRAGSGALSGASCIDDNDVGPETCPQSTDGLDGATGVAVSPDERSLYVAAQDDRDVARFDRADEDSPKTSITDKPKATTKSTKATLKFTSSEPLSTFKCSLDGAAFKKCSSPTRYTNLSKGTHNFKVRATDPSGNTDSSPAKASWKVKG